MTLKTELNSSLEAEIALAVVAAREIVAEAGQLIIRIDEPDRDVLRDREVNPTADRQSKRIITGRFASTDSGVFVASIRVKVAVGTT